MSGGVHPVKRMYAASVLVNFIQFYCAAISVSLVSMLSARVPLFLMNLYSSATGWRLSGRFFSSPFHSLTWAATSGRGVEK